MKHKKRHRKKHCCRSAKPASSRPVPIGLELLITIGDLTIRGKNMKLNVPALTLIALAIGQVFGALGKVLDHATLGLLTWVSSDPSIADIKFDVDGKPYLVPTGKAGTVFVTVTGDENPDTPQTFSGQLEVTFAEDEVATVDIVGSIVSDPSAVTFPEPTAQAENTDTTSAG
jgi:hypothetical protein